MNAVDTKAAGAASAPAAAEQSEAGSGRAKRLDAAAIAAKFTELKSSPQ